MAFFRKQSQPDDDPDALTAAGMQHLQKGDAAAAVQAFGAAVQIDPQHGQAWYGKGCAHGELGQYEDAIHAYRQSAQFAGERAGLPLFNLGNIYQELNQYQEAARCFHQAVQADPTMADAWINLGRILDDAGQHEAAIECYDNALMVEPEDVMAWSNRGNSLRSLKRFADGLESYRKALEFDSDDFAARIGIGACLVECGQPDEGIAALQKATEETRHPLAMFEFATALAKTGQHESAVSMYGTLIDAEFVSAEIWNNRAECLASLGQVDASLESFDRAIEFDAAFAPAWFGKARVLANAERTAEAQPVAQRYLELADEEERSHPSVQALLRMCGIDP
jgi:tetratricopeptide (TPR) repeat protein